MFSFPKIKTPQFKIQSCYWLLKEKKKGIWKIFLILKIFLKGKAIPTLNFWINF